MLRNGANMRLLWKNSAKSFVSREEIWIGKNRRLKEILHHKKAIC